MFTEKNLPVLQFNEVGDFWSTISQNLQRKILIFKVLDSSLSSLSLSLSMQECQTSWKPLSWYNLGMFHLYPRTETLINPPLRPGGPQSTERYVTLAIFLNPSSLLITGLPSLTPGLESLKKLESLSLAHNFLSVKAFEKDGPISHLQSLKRLDLSYNLLTSIPPLVFHLLK